MLSRSPLDVAQVTSPPPSPFMTVRTLVEVEGVTTDFTNTTISNDMRIRFGAALPLPVTGSGVDESIGLTNSGQSTRPKLSLTNFQRQRLESPTGLIASLTSSESGVY